MSARRPKLDEWLARVFDDQEPASFGSGWISGTTSVFLGLLSVGGVVCLRFPDVLTWPGLREVYALSWIRPLVADGPVYAYLVFVSFHAVFIHANVRFRFGAAEHWIVTPRFHHWHHSAQPEAWDKNFAYTSHLIWPFRRK